jgi:hypothetical protein
MSHYRDEIHCRIDPEQTDELADGRAVQPVSVIMTDDYDPGRDRHPLRPSICTLGPDEARELAFELLAAAEHAESFGEWSRP